MKSSLIRVPKVLHPSSRWLLAIGLLWLVVSCQPNAPLESPEPEPSDDLSIAEAKAWFTDYVASPANARTAADDKFAKREADWDNAYNYALTKKQKMVVVPISHYKRGTTPEYKQLWVYKNKNGKNTMRVVEYVFAEQTTTKAQTIRDFTGYLLIKDWDDNVLGGFELKNNKFVGALTKQKPGGRTSGFVCGEWISCRWVTVGHANDPSGGYTYRSCITDYRCVWAGSTEQSDAPVDGGQDDPGGGTITFPQDPTPPDDIFYKPQIFNKECEGWIWMDIYQSNHDREVSGVYTKEGKLIIFPIESNQLTSSFWHKEYVVNGITILKFGYDNSGKLLTTIYNSNGTIDVYTVSYMIHTHPVLENCDEPSPMDTYNREGDRFIASLYPTVKHFILGCTKFIEFDSGTFTKKSPLPNPNDCK